MILSFRIDSDAGNISKFEATMEDAIAKFEAMRDDGCLLPFDLLTVVGGANIMEVNREGEIVDLRAK